MKPQANSQQRVKLLSLLLLILGLWIAFSTSIGFVARGNFKVVALENLRKVDTVFANIENGEPRNQALRYIASELNRYYFSKYQWVNLFLALAGLICIVKLKSRLNWQGYLLAYCLLTSLFALFFIPYVTEVGRSIDFLPRVNRPPEVQQFLRLHLFYLAVEFSKYLFLWIVSISLMLNTK